MSTCSRTNKLSSRTGPSVSFKDQPTIELVANSSGNERNHRTLINGEKTTIKGRCQEWRDRIRNGFSSVSSTVIISYLPFYDAFKENSDTPLYSNRGNGSIRSKLCALL